MWNTWRYVVLYASLLVFVLINWQMPCISATKEHSRFVSIPVNYLTDRDLRGETFGSRRRYASDCKHQMYYGTANVVVQNRENKDATAMSVRLGWKSSNAKGSTISAKDKIDPADGNVAKVEFFHRLKQSLAQSGKNELCVFVHGACDAFEDCALDAATMAYYLEKPVVLYSWPSNPKWRSYFIDGGNAEWSQGHFNMFCKNLLKFKEEQPVQVTFVSHSMGNRLVIRSLPVTYGKGLVSNWELVSPDIDADTCRHYIWGYDKDTSKIRLYVSNRDKMLPIAQILYGGYHRLGEAANQAVLPKSWSRATPGQMERIDFTNIDTGFQGHTVPFSLIANIINNNHPGPNLELIQETRVTGNRLVRLGDRSEKLDATVDELPDFCKIVVRTKAK